MKLRKLPLALAAVAMLAAGCGRSDDDDGAAAATAPAPAPTATPPTSTTVAPASKAATADAAKIGESDLGQLLVSTDGLTLYGFINDVDAISTCYSTCAEAWPPVIVEAEWTVGPGLDTGIFATTERDDGTLQLVAGKYPLYTFGGDAAPGDLTGQGSGDVWFAVGLDGSLLEGDAAGAVTDEGGIYGDGGDAAAETTVPAEPTESSAPAPPPADLAPAPIATAPTALGDVLVDGFGLTLYGFTNDGDGTPTCEGGCAEAWPPVIVDSAELPAGLDPNVFSVVQRPDGTFQMKAGKWPLYRFAGDAAPGETNGQGSGDAWFVVDPTGGLIKNAG